MPLESGMRFLSYRSRVCVRRLRRRRRLSGFLRVAGRASARRTFALGPDGIDDWLVWRDGTPLMQARLELLDGGPFG